MMLIEFSVQNFRSFYDRVTFSMEASNRSEHPEHVIEVSRQKLLKSSALYGANASGKSNLFKAFIFMKEMVLSSSKDTQAGEAIPVEAFLLNTQGAQEPTTMEVIYLVDDILYRYGFSCSAKRVEKEWLYSRNTRPRSRELRLFERDFRGNYHSHPSFKEAKGSLQVFLRENTLLISLLAQFNGETSRLILDCFINTNIWDLDFYMPLHTSLMIQKELVPPAWVREFLINADLGIKDFQIEEKELSWDKLRSIPAAIKEDTNKYLSHSISTSHEYFDENSGEFKRLLFDLEKQESSGTKQFFSMAGVIYYALQHGGCLLIDELEKSLHPLLCRIIIRLFQDPQTNPKGAQLIFSTHDTTLMDKALFRRDELWFVEKDSDCSSDLYSLVEYKMEKGKARNDSSYGKDYIRGKYGAIPYTKYDDFAKLFRK